MANPRQRRKVRSSSHKPIKISRQANKLLKKQPPIKGPKILQDAWDKHKTVRQNYAALGLAHSLTPTDSGGRDITHLQVLHSTESRSAGSNRLEDAASGTRQKIEAASKDSKGAKAGGREGETPGSGTSSIRKETPIPRGYGKIVRDEKGNVVDVILEDDGGQPAMAKEMELADNELDRRQPESLPGADWLLKGEVQTGMELDVVGALEDRSREGAPRVARTSSSAEVKYLQQLVETYGEDYEGMARDRKRNVQQYTAGQLKRAIAKAQLR